MSSTNRDRDALSGDVPPVADRIRTGRGGCHRRGGTAPVQPAFPALRMDPSEDSMNALKPLALIALLAVALAGCNDRKAESTTPTKPDSTKLEPQTDQSPPEDRKPKQ
jgi:hypothetical protein